MDTSESRFPHRRFTNFLLQPVLQTKIGLYCIILSFCFALAIMGLLYSNLGDLFHLIVGLTEAPEEVQDIILSHLSSLQAWVYGSLACYILAIVIISIWYTHRLVGPVIAFTRHFEALERGDFAARTVLRKGDAFHESAAALNRATEALEKRSVSKS